MKTKLAALLTTAAFFCACGEKPDDETPDFSKRIFFNQNSVTLIEGETFSPVLKMTDNGKTGEYDLAANPEGLEYSSSSPETASVDKACKVTALRPGTTTVKASAGRLSAKFTVTVNGKDYNIPDLSKPLTEDMIYGQYTINSSEGNVNPQSFDVDDRGDVWLEGARRPYVYIQHATKAGKVNTSKKTLDGYSGESTMRIYYAGHGTCLNVEPGCADGERYIWFANFGTKQTTGSDAGAYLKPRILSRTKYLPGQTIYPEDAEENYWFGENFIQMLPSIDFDNRVIAIWVSSKKTITIFSLDDVLDSPVKEITIPGLLWGGDSERYKTETTVSKKINVHDCTGIKPLKTLTVNTTTALSGSSTQGFCVYGPDKKLFLMTNVTTDLDVRVSIQDPSGRYIRESLGVGYDDNQALCTQYGLTPKNYLEAEGITIRKGIMYHCLAATWGSTRVASIIAFK